MFSSILRRNLIVVRNDIHFWVPRTFAQHNVSKTGQLELTYLCNLENQREIETNIKIRKGIGNIQLVHALKAQLDATSKENKEYSRLQNQLLTELLKIPNRTHPEVKTYGDELKVVKKVGSPKNFDKDPMEFHEITRRLKIARTEQLGNVTGSKSYYILGELAELEQALIRYFVENLLRNNFHLISVPDILPRHVVEGCGMDTRANRNQVYTLESELHGPDWCLSGTSEIALAGFLKDKVLSEDDLPLKLVAVSRCYRAETSNVVDERGIFRVHEFTKVEMFIATTPGKSDETLEEVRKIQEKCFESLGLHYFVYDMPPHELGAQAYRKYDVEAWMCGRKIYGEISSCSNCTEYQSRRLGIRYKTLNGNTNFVHTLNGTAVAIPRLLIALVEQGQNSNGTITIPEVLHTLMKGKTFIGKQKKVPELRLIKSRK